MYIFHTIDQILKQLDTERIKKQVAESLNTSKESIIETVKRFNTTKR